MGVGNYLLVDIILAEAIPSTCNHNCATIGNVLQAPAETVVLLHYSNRFPRAQQFILVFVSDGLCEHLADNNIADRRHAPNRGVRCLHSQNSCNSRCVPYLEGDEMDVSHTKDGRAVLENQHDNRARNRGKK